MMSLQSMSVVRKSSKKKPRKKKIQYGRCKDFWNISETSHVLFPRAGKKIHIFFLLNYWRHRENVGIFLFLKFEVWCSVPILQRNDCGGSVDVSRLLRAASWETENRASDTLQQQRHYRQSSRLSFYCETSAFLPVFQIIYRLRETRPSVSVYC